METITNAASTAATTVSNLVFGQPNTKDNEAASTTANNETAGNEPVSGEQGKGTVAEPFDKGNSENPAGASSTSDEFLKLSPAVGKPATTDASTSNKTGTDSESAIPVVPLNPDDSALGSGKSTTATTTETGNTDKAGVTDKTYKETPLDDIKLSGAPGAGPSAPAHVTPAAGETSTTSGTSNPASEQHHTDTTVGSTSTPAHKDSSAPKQAVDSEIDAILNKGASSKAEHTVNDAEAENPHSKMNEKTVRQTDAAKHSDDSESKGLAEHAAGRKSESSPATDSTSPAGGEEKSGKMSALKGKLKDKLHIGSKDK